MRELQEKYRLSPSTVLAVMKELTAEGLLRSVPRVGVFVADAAAFDDQNYLMVTPAPGTPAATPHAERMRLGFEERITQRGGASLCMSIDAVMEDHQAGALPPLAGVYVATTDTGLDPGAFVASQTPVVRLSPSAMNPDQADAVVDTVYMDNIDGGRRAAQHLAQYGHRRIAFLGLHPESGPTPFYTWSAKREQGWRDVMEELGESVARMVFQPEVLPSGYDQEVDAAKAAAVPILMRRDISAVVCANDHAMIGLLTALGDANVPPEAWPSLVGFDGSDEVYNHALTSMRLPWEDIGRQAAELLSDRANGRLTGPGRHYELPMSLVTRIGSRKNWPGQAATRLSAGS